MFQRSQHKLTRANSILRPHKIPCEVYDFALEAQRRDKTPPGVGKKNLPTMPDIFHALTFEGLEIVEAGHVRPVFIEREPPDYKTKQIRFSKSDNDRLKALQDRIYAGDFKYGPWKTFPLNAIAVTLMEVAIEARAKVTLKPFYFSCGFIHRRELESGAIWDKDSLIQVNAPDGNTAYHFVLEKFGSKWGNIYETKPSMEFVKNGVVGIFTQTIVNTSK